MRNAVRFILSTGFIVLSFTAPAAGSNHSGVPAWAIQNRPSTATLSFPAFDRLYTELQQNGSARLIVRFRDLANLPQGFQAEGKLTDTKEVERQRKAIEHTQSVLESRLTAKGKARAKKFSHIPFMALEVDAADFQALLDSPEVDLIEEDTPVPPALAESVPLIGGDGMGEFSGYDGTGQTVAILDTGVAKTHPALSGKVVAEACYSSTTASSVTVCPNGLSEQTTAGAGVNCSTGVYACDHGTHVAGIAAGSAGVAKGANIIAIQVFSRFNSGCGSSPTPCALTWTSDYIKGLERVYALRGTYNIAAANMSLGGGSYSANCDATSAASKAAIDNLRSVGIATVIASGNNGYTTAISSPACISSAISVGSTTKTNTVASYSNSASLIELLAPGSSIYAPVPGNTFAFKSGTSMATPHVAGAWAVIKSRKPTATVDEVLSALTDTGISITDSRNGVAKPRIKLDTAVMQIPVEPRLQFASATYFVNENAGTATITIRRDISSTGAVSVDWAASNGTATDGEDYTAASGTISFADGESGDKTFTVSVSDDVATEATESINLTLSTPTGGAIIGSLNTTVLNIMASDSTDFTHDDKRDILWRDSSTGQNTIWAMDGATRTSTFPLDSVPVAWDIVGKADFNGDGNIDILWRNASTGQNAVWPMNGAVRLPYAIYPAVYLDSLSGVDWKIKALADFDKDGKADILWFNSSNKQLHIWRMNGTSRIGVINVLTTAGGWDVIGVEDFNGDGFYDILWRDSISGKNAVLLMNGTATINTTLLETLPAYWKCAGLTDFDKDGKVDILWRNGSNGQNMIWKMNGTSRTQTSSLLTVADTNWTIAGIADFDNDLNEDLFWRNASTGQNAIWYMNGLNKTGSAYTDSLTKTWKVVNVVK